MRLRVRTIFLQSERFIYDVSELYALSFCLSTLTDKSFCLPDPPHSLQMVTLRSRGEPGRSVLAATADGHLGRRRAPIGRYSGWSRGHVTG